MDSAIVIMSRVPRPGHTKTRLMKRLTPLECADFHRACLQDICRAVKKTGSVGYIYYHDGLPAAEKSTALPEYFPEECQGFIIREQAFGDLGQKLEQAAGEVLAEHKKIIFLGADLPSLTSELFIKVFAILDQKDLVIGPAKDGGYYLLALQKPYACLFRDIPWGSAEVFLQTVRAAESNGLSYELLDVQSDIDTWTDLIGFYHCLSMKDARSELDSYRLVAELAAKYEGASEKTKDKIMRKAIVKNEEINQRQQWEDH